MVQGRPSTGTHSIQELLYQNQGYHQMQQELLNQLEASRCRLNLSPAELRQLAFEVVQGVSWPVRSESDLNVEQLKKLLDVMKALERTEISKRLRSRELVTR